VEYVVVCGVAFFVSGLTLFSGFGLGTLLMPAIALFFPLSVAVAVTAVVHLANNLFKTALVGRRADWSVVLRFALPGAVAAMAGASLLNKLSQLPPVFRYHLLGRSCEADPVDIVIGGLITVFAVFDLLPRFRSVTFDRKYLVAGGALSGFSGGISGVQGALRSAFLMKAGLNKDAFVGTNTVSAVIVDLARLLVYGIGFYTASFSRMADTGGLIFAAALSAFIGSFAGARLLKKVTLRMIQVVVGVMLIMVGLGLATGLL
jgi:uncharacterized membrane protein YfcA